MQLELDFNKEKVKKIDNHKFKDKCDNCKNFDYLKGYGNECLCEKCINELENNKWKK